MRKQKKKTLVLPGLTWDGSEWSPISKWPNFICYSDKILAEILGTNKTTVGEWRIRGIIPFIMEGSFARFNVNDCIQALLKAGYKQDMTKKSRENERT